ncbi:probable signal peptidase complex subunit 1 isoform X1 [Durio zibethinus]|uniref:Signal peptidase complex subunit 1 n=1 Tax=Durio zibethinus TaxID=66656 RepID=A0A6P5Y2J2_DURZI|nr:probable signal peptidase complex subunit 1 isoform X1 [Durio zibethinus]
MGLFNYILLLYEPQRRAGIIMLVNVMIILVDSSLLLTSTFRHLSPSLHSSRCFPMDWQGQKFVEQIMQISLLVFAVIALVAGYVLGSFHLMMLVYAGGVTLTTLITVPNWPFFNRNPLNWLDPNEVEKHHKPQVAVSLKKKATQK